jgi:glutamine synthetase
MFLGDQLTDIVEQLASGSAKTSKTGGQLKLGVSSLPQLPKDSTDRNRTSPFAFTGNKFEFRMVGSSQSTAGPMFVLNTIVAQSLMEIADELEKSSNVKATVQKIITKIAKENSRVIFNGDNYTEAWAKEAEKRGLPNIRSSVDATKIIADEENVKLFTTHKVLSKAELKARTEILLEAYSTTICIEGKTALNIAQRQILPTAIEYASRLGKAIERISDAGSNPDTEKKILNKTCGFITELSNSIDELKQAIAEICDVDNSAKKAEACRDRIVAGMNAVRKAADELELIVDAKMWPLPTYAEMLFGK